MMVKHFYHVYAAGAWSEPVTEHFKALGEAGLDDMSLVIGMVGPEDARFRARERITGLCREWKLPEPSCWAEADHGWEQVTLKLIYDEARYSTGDYNVLYMHTKGAANPSDGSSRWRQSMTRELVGGWRRCTRLLWEHDVVGCHWVKAPQWPEQVPFFAGNFWWSKASYLRTLDPPLTETRWQPEVWVSGDGSPRVFDLLPRWPDYGDP